MGFIKAGFTGGFLGIVLSIANIFVNSRILKKLSSVGLYLANFFGKACINTEEIQCTLAEKFTTIIATIVGNCIAYFILFVLVSLAISIIKMWFKSKPKELETLSAPQTAQVQVQQPSQFQTAQAQPQVQTAPAPVQTQIPQSVQIQIKQQEPQVARQPEQKEIIQKEKRPKKKSKVNQKSKKK